MARVTRAPDERAATLWREHARRRRYPPGVLPVPHPIPGTAFFPGGFGWHRPALLGPEPRFPEGGIMVLGHDFHSEMGYRASVERGCEAETQPTWRNLLSLLSVAGISPANCFFTNFFMGLRAGSRSTGEFPGARDAAFVRYCRRFLIRQLGVQRPRLILTLGVYVPHFIAPLSPQLAAWGVRRGLAHIDAAGAIHENVEFRDVAGLRTTVVALVHPCLRHSAVRHRRFEGLSGDAAERQLLRAALAS